MVQLQEEAIVGLACGRQQLEEPGDDDAYSEHCHCLGCTKIF